MKISIHGIPFEAESIQYDQYGMAEIWYKWDAIDFSSRQTLANVGVYSTYDPNRDLSRIFTKADLIKFLDNKGVHSNCECGRVKHNFIEHMFYCPMWKVDNGEK